MSHNKSLASFQLGQCAAIQIQCLDNLLLGIDDLVIQRRRCDFNEARREFCEQHLKAQHILEVCVWIVWGMIHSETRNLVPPACGSNIGDYLNNRAHFGASKLETPW